MFRKLTISAAALALLLMVGCSSKPKATDDTGSSEPAITNEPMGFNPQGSDSGEIAGLNTIYFDYDKAVLSPDAKATLAGNANWMKANPNARLEIEGHCDSRGTNEYNLALGERRANTVRNYLASMGVSNDRLSVVSYGEEKPIMDGDSEAAYAKNRRANFVPR